MTSRNERKFCRKETEYAPRIYRDTSY